MSNHDHQDSRNSEELESDIQHTRSHLDETLHQLEDRFSPDQIMNTALGYVRSSGSKDFFANLGETAKQNPVPVALMGLGIGWLMYSNSSAKRHKSGSAQHVAWQTNEPVPDSMAPVPTTSPTGDAATSAIHSPSSASHVAATPAPSTPNVASTTGTTRAAASPGIGGGHPADPGYATDPGHYTDTSNYSSDYRAHHPSSHQQTSQHSQGRMGALKGKTSGLMGSVKAKLSGSGGHMQDRMSNMKSSAQHSMQHMSERTQGIGPQTSDFIKEHPLVVGALGVALGAALGGMLPSTRTEQKAMGSTRDNLMHKASEAGQQQFDKAKTRANEVKDQALGAAQQRDPQQKEEAKDKDRPGQTSAGTSTPAPEAPRGTAATGGLDSSTTPSSTSASPTTTSSGIQGTRSVSASPSSYTDPKKDDKR